jgi:hypothetical protein
MEEQLVNGESVYEEHSGDRAVQQNINTSGEFYSSAAGGSAAAGHGHAAH